MKITIRLLKIACAIICLTGWTQAATLIGDDFGSGSVITDDSSFRPSDVDNGWRATNSSTWSISGGVMQNTGDGNTAANEGGLMQQVSVGAATGTQLNLTFDYNLTAAGESLSVFLWGGQGSYDLDGRLANMGHTAADGSGRIQYLELNLDNSLISSTEFTNGATISQNPPDGYLGENGLSGVDYTYFAKISGATSGTFSQNIDLTQWVTNGVEDFDFITVVFARDAVAGSNVTIDDLSLTSFTPTTPEPSSLGLILLGAALLSKTRKGLK